MWRNIEQMMGVLNLDFAALDFKYRRDRDETPVFLEVNTAPMFEAFDRHSDGELAEAIVRTLQ